MNGGCVDVLQNVAVEVENTSPHTLLLFVGAQ